MMMPSCRLSSSGSTIFFQIFHQTIRVAASVFSNILDTDQGLQSVYVASVINVHVMDTKSIPSLSPAYGDACTVSGVKQSSHNHLSPTLSILSDWGPWSLLGGVRGLTNTQPTVIDLRNYRLLLLLSPAVVHPPSFFPTGLC